MMFNDHIKKYIILIGFILIGPLSYAQVFPTPTPVVTDPPEPPVLPTSTPTPVITLPTEPPVIFTPTPTPVITQTVPPVLQTWTATPVITVPPTLPPTTTPIATPTSPDVGVEDWFIL